MATVHETETLSNLDHEPALDRRLRELRDEVFEEYQPTEEDYEWMRAADLDSFLPRDLGLAEWVEAKSRQAMLLDDERHEWLGRKIGELAQLVRWTGASSPAEHDDRMETYERELRERS